MDIASWAMVAGVALVSASATDAGEEVRREVSRLFGRGQPDSAIDRLVSATDDQIAAAPWGRSTR